MYMLNYRASYPRKQKSSIVVLQNIQCHIPINYIMTYLLPSIWTQLKYCEIAENKLRLYRLQSTTTMSALIKKVHKNY
jgi:hypothetical protein